MYPNDLVLRTLFKINLLKVWFCIWHTFLKDLGPNIIPTRVGWKVQRLTMMNWSNLTICGLFFNIVSPAVHTVLPSVLQRLDLCGIEALILILEKVNCKYDLIIGPILLPSQVFWLLFFSFWGTENSQMVPNQENMGGGGAINQFKATVTHSSHCHHRLACRSIVLVKQDSPCHFSRTVWYVSSATFQSPELLIQCGFFWKETMQLVSGKVNFNAPQVSLLWYNSFSVSLWTFQPTLVNGYIFLQFA